MDQGYGRVYRHVLSDKRISAGARLAYSIIKTYQGANKLSWPSYQTIAEVIGCSRRQAIRYVEELESVDIAKINRHHGRSNEYEILDSDTGVTSDTHVTTVVTPMSPTSDTGVTHISNIKRNKKMEVASPLVGVAPRSKEDERLVSSMADLLKAKTWGK